MPVKTPFLSLHKRGRKGGYEVRRSGRYCLRWVMGDDPAVDKVRGARTWGECRKGRCKGWDEMRWVGGDTVLTKVILCSLWRSKVSEARLILSWNIGKIPRKGKKGDEGHGTLLMLFRVYLFIFLSRCIWHRYQYCREALAVIFLFCSLRVLSQCEMSDLRMAQKDLPVFAGCVLCSYILILKEIIRPGSPSDYNRK